MLPKHSSRMHPCSRPQRLASNHRLGSRRVGAANMIAVMHHNYALIAVFIGLLLLGSWFVTKQIMPGCTRRELIVGTIVMAAMVGLAVFIPDIIDLVASLF